jgi:plasmid maintenance system antidote protein VapI
LLAASLPIEAMEVMRGNIRRNVPMEEILTASQVAQLLQVHPRTVYKLVKQGSIPGKIWRRVALQ